jgi:hypothetical protein
LLPALVSAGVLCCAQGAYAATFTVDDDKADCPAAAFTSVQAAVDAASTGDTIVICKGDYVEGSGAPGTSALTITKGLTLKGAGADLVTITPKASSVAGGSILEATSDLRNGLGDIVAIVGTPTQPIKVDISGVTVDGYDPAGRPVAVEAGIVFLDAKGSVVNSHVTNTVTSEGDNAYLHPGGWRGTQPGIGIAQTSAALLAPVDGSRRLEITRTRVDKYNRIGILIDGAQNDFAPFTPSGSVNWGVITASQVIGRTLCVNYAGTGSCNTPGLVTTGPLFGQDGVRVTTGAYAAVDSSLISQNLVNGTGAPVRGITAPDATNNANLSLGAGLRYAGARLTSYTGATGLVVDSRIQRSNIVDNAYGAINVAADGVTANVGLPIPRTTGQSPPGYGPLLIAENNWWGVRNFGTDLVTPPPAISPTTNPPVPENPVNGAPTPDTTGGPTTSNAVDYYPYRSGPQSDPTAGAFPVLTAPLPVADTAPTDVTLTAPASADRGTAITLTAAGNDDFGIKRVRFTDGSATAGVVTLPPYTQSVTIPADATCGSTRSYSAVVMDSAGQTKSASTSVTVTCPTPPQPAVKPPTIAFASAPTTLAAKTRVQFTPVAEAGVKQVDLFLGTRKVCTLTAAPFTACDVVATGADVGAQALRVVVTDALGSTAQSTANVTVAKFATKVTTTIKTTKVKGNKAKRTISGKIAVPANVTRAQACSGKVTVTIKRSGRSVLNQQVSLSKTCTFSRSITAARSKQSYSVTAKFGGNTVLSTASQTRRFS